MVDHNKDRFKTIEILEQVEKIVTKRQDAKSADKQWLDLTLSINWLMLLNQRMADVSRHCVDMHFRSVSKLDPDTAFHNTRDAVLNMAAACIEMVQSLENNRVKNLNEIVSSSKVVSANVDADGFGTITTEDGKNYTLDPPSKITLEDFLTE